VTSLITKATESTMRSGSLESPGTTLGLIAIGLLVIVLIERELLRTLAGAPAAARVRALAIVGTPLGLTALTVIFLRLAALT